MGQRFTGEIFLFVCAVLRRPIFAGLALLIVALSLPVGFALYTGLLGMQELPVMAVITLYLMLGIGVDIIFVFVNMLTNDDSDATDDNVDGSNANGADGARFLRSVQKSVTVTTLTMSTSFATFLASTASPIVMIRQFAYFQAAVLLSSYGLVIFLFIPLLASWRHTFMRTYPERGKYGHYCVVRIVVRIVAALLAPSRTTFWHNCAPHMYQLRHKLLVAWLCIGNLRICRYAIATDERPTRSFWS